MNGDVKLSKSSAKVLQAFLVNPREEQYGFALMRSTEVKSGSLYPILERFERLRWIEGLDESIDEHAEGRRRRRLYRLTALGEREARKAVAEFYRDVGRPRFLDGEFWTNVRSRAARVRELALAEVAEITNGMGLEASGLPGIQSVAVTEAEAKGDTNGDSETSASEHGTSDSLAREDLRAALQTTPPGPGRSRITEALERICLILDGELSPDRCAELKVHLQRWSERYGRHETERLFKDLIRLRCGSLEDEDLANLVGKVSSSPP